MQDDLSEIIREEEQFWSEQFKKESETPHSEKLFSSYWWEAYYKEIIMHFSQYISKDSKVLEPGCGSGKASILLGEKVDRTFLDISPKALEYAERLANRFKAKNIFFKEGNIFQLPFSDKIYDLTWNIGVAEHYELRTIEDMLQEMIRVTKPNGIVAFAVPNKYSGPILKAAILNWKVFSWASGYRLHSEKFYTENQLKETFLRSIEKSKRRHEFLEVKRFGNPLPMETPPVILKTLGPILSQLLPKNRFITFYICKVL